MVFPSFVAEVLSTSQVIREQYTAVGLMHPFVVIEGTFYVQVSILMSVRRMTSSEVDVNKERGVAQMVREDYFYPYSELPPSSMVSMSCPFSDLQVGLYT